MNKGTLLLILMAAMFLISILGMLFLGLLSSSAEAKDFGVQGHTMEIKERDLLEHIQESLASMEAKGRIRDIQEELQAKTIKRIRAPRSVLGIGKSYKKHLFTHDPTIVVPRDIKDHKGTLLHAKGKRVNPLDYHAFRQKWFFIEGEDRRQVDWALGENQKINQSGIQSTKIILVNGSPFDLSETHGVRFYFDQLGKITEQLGVKRVPSMAYQCGKKICIEEVPLWKEGGEEEESKQECSKDVNPALSSKMIIVESNSSPEFPTRKAYLDDSSIIALPSPVRLAMSSPKISESSDSKSMPEKKEAA